MIQSRTAAINGCTDHIVVMTPTLTPLMWEKYMVMNMEDIMPKKRQHIIRKSRR